MLTLLKKITLLLSLMFLYVKPALADASYSPQLDLKIGGLIQPVYYYSDNPILSDRDTLDFKIRRARLLAKAQIDNWVHSVIQTEYAETPSSSGADMHIIDAYVNFDLNNSVKLYVGQFIAPALRQNISLTSTLMTMESPGITYKSLSWGTRAMGKFNSLTINNTDAGLRGNVDVRDLGAMILARGNLTNKVSYKYYGGMFEGAQSAQSERLVVRGQINIGDAESEYYNHASYYGKKNTMALGLSLDTQNKVAIDQESQSDVDYTLTSMDFFAEKPLGNSISISLEAAWIELNLSDASFLLDPITGNMISTVSAQQAQGNGYYIQTGLNRGSIQTWLAYEQWRSDDENRAGSYTGARIGLRYQLNTHANIKVGYEQIESEQDFSTSIGKTRSLDSISMGLLITF